MSRLSRRRLSIKGRLALMCGALFLLSGTVLLTVNYLLVRAALPPVATGRVDSPSSEPGVVTGPVEMVDRAGDLARYRADVLNVLLGQSAVTLVVTILLALLLGWVVASRMLRPVQAVASTARRLGADSLDQRIRMDGPRDELTDLADTFDDMLDRLAASFDSQRRFVANASHELRTPLAAQRTLVEVAMARPGADPTVRQLCARLLAMNVRIEALIEGLLVLARSDRGLEGKTPVRLDKVVESVLAAHRDAAAGAGVTVHHEPALCVVPGDRVLLERLVNNLVDNAIKYNRPGGDVWVRVGGPAALEVANTGPAVPTERTSELFEPFRQLGRRLDGANHGVGLGLSIVASIVRAHGGSMRAEPRVGGGLQVAVRFPRGQ